MTSSSSTDANSTEVNSNNEIEVINDHPTNQEDNNYVEVELDARDDNVVIPTKKEILHFK